MRSGEMQQADRGDARRGASALSNVQIRLMVLAQGASNVLFPRKQFLGPQTIVTARGELGRLLSYGWKRFDPCSGTSPTGKLLQSR